MAWRYTYKEDDQVNSHSEEDGEGENGRNGAEPSQDDPSDLNLDPQLSSTDDPNIKTEIQTPQFLFDEYFLNNSDEVQTIIMSCDDDGSNFEPEEATKIDYGRREMVDAPFSRACRYCFTTFPTAKEVDAHVSKYHPEEDEAEKEELAKSLPLPIPVQTQSSTNGQFTCAECGKNLSTLRTLREHSRIHTGEKPYACDYCPSVFGFRANLRRHIKFVHFQGKDAPATITPDNSDSPYGRYICRTCGQVFTTSAYLNKHLKTHVSPEKRIFACTAPMCKKRFNDKPSLRVHMSTHTGEKSFVCGHPGCGKKFTTKQACVLHGRIQHQFGAPSTATAQGPFVCSDCGRTCPSLVSLKIHVMNYHPAAVPQRQGQGQRQSMDIKPFSTPVSLNNGMTVSTVGQSGSNSVRAGPSNRLHSIIGSTSILRSSAGQSTSNSGQSTRAGSSNTLRALMGASDSRRISLDESDSDGGSNSQRAAARAGPSTSAPMRGLRTTIVPPNNLRAGIHAINTARTAAAAAAGTNTFHALRQSVIGPHNAQAQAIPTFQVGRPRQFWCDEPECGKSYVSAQGLRHHKLMMHSGTKKTPHVCRQCGQGFLRRWVLRAHLKTHTNEKEANFCSLCNESYERHRAHMRSFKHVEKLREAGVGVGAGGQMEVKAEADMDDEWVGQGEGEGDDDEGDGDMDDNDEYEGEGEGQGQEDDDEDSQEYVGQDQGQGQDDAEVEYDYDIEEVETDEYGNPI